VDAVDRVDGVDESARTVHHATAGRRGPWLAALACLLVAGAALAVAGVALAREQAARAAQADLARQQQDMLSLLDSPQVWRATLRAPSPTAGSPTGRLFTRPDRPTTLVTTTGLTPPPAGQTYQVWVRQTSAAPTLMVGTLPVQPNGFGALLFDEPEPGLGYDRVMVTLQPPDASVPALPPVLVFDLVR
jgi:hypothetical protein